MYSDVAMRFMMSPTSQRPSHRTLATSIAALVTIIILLSLYNLGDARVASNGLPIQTSNDGKHAAKIPTDGATKPTSSLSSTHGNKQDAVTISTDNDTSSATATTSAVDVARVSASTPSNAPRRAFITFLEADTGTNHGDEAQAMDPDNEDKYFVGGLHQTNNFISPIH